MTEEQVRAVADAYARSHNLPVAGIKKVVREPPDLLFGRDKVRGGDVWTVFFRRLDEEEVICSRIIYVEIDDITGEITEQ